MSFDIVIPLGPNELSRIDNNVEYIKQNIIGYRNIYLVSYRQDIHIPGCITIYETFFPFTKKDIQSYFSREFGLSRGGWYLQQLLKLYAGFCIPNILKNYLVLDADLFILNPLEFMQDGKFLFGTGDEYYIPYFVHMEKLHPDLKKMHSESGICHHMMFHVPYVKEMFELVENNHNGKPFWKIFLENVIDGEMSGASEYEMYFNFMIKNHPEDMIIRHLNWANVSSRNPTYNAANYNGYDYVSICHYK